MNVTGRKFLIVDDHSLMRRIIAAEIKKLGAVKIHEAADGSEALRKIMAEKEAGAPYDVVFLDWSMPSTDGMDVLLSSRSDHSLDHMAIIMLTSEAEDQNVLRALESGATAYVTKPFKGEDLVVKLEDVFEWQAKNKAAAHG